MHNIRLQKGYSSSGKKEKPFNNIKENKNLFLLEPDIGTCYRIPWHSTGIIFCESDSQTSSIFHICTQCAPIYNDPGTMSSWKLSSSITVLRDV